MTARIVDSAILAVEEALHQIARLEADRAVLLQTLRDLHSAVTDKLLDIEHDSDESWLQAFDALMAALRQAQTILQQAETKTS